MISSRRYYLRFVYTPRPLRDMPSRMEAQLLRECALRSRAWPALLVVDGAVLIPARRDPQAAVLLSAQAAEYARLWQWAGGRWGAVRWRGLFAARAPVPWRPENWLKRSRG